MTQVTTMASPLELMRQRDDLRERGVDIVVKPTSKRNNTTMRNYTFELYFPPIEGKGDSNTPSRPLGVWHSYYDALQAAIKSANESIELAKKLYGIKI